MPSNDFGTLAGNLMEDIDNRIEEQERKIAKNLDLSRKSEVLFNNAEAMIAKQKNGTHKQCV